MGQFDGKALEAILGVTMSDGRLLERACTHRSLSKHNNERLEFLGDAVLGAVIADRLYAKHPDATEGDLTHMRSNLVRGEMLTDIAKTSGIAAFLRCAPGDCERRGILADVLEAIIAAVYLDLGAPAAEGVIDRLFAPHLATVTAEAALKDAKTELQEWVQARALPLPVYEIEATGPPHQRVFKARCTVQGMDPVQGPEASTRRAAEKAVAQIILESLPHDN